MTFDRLYKVGRKLNLDGLLAAALSQNLEGELGQIIVNKSEEMINETPPRKIRGRQMLFLVYRFYRTNERLGFLYNILDLKAVVLTDDKHLAQFLVMWDHTVNRLSKKQTGENLQLLLYEQLKKSEIMSMTSSTTSALARTIRTIHMISCSGG